MVNDLLSSFTAQPVVAVAIVVGIVVIALARFTNSLESLRKFLQSDSATEHWFFGWVIEGVNRRVGSLIILQLIFGCTIYPIVVLYSLQSMTIPGNGLYDGIYEVVLALKWIVAILSILIAVGSWRVQYRLGVIQGTVIPIVAWLILRHGTRFLLMRDVSYLPLVIPFTGLGSLFVFLWFGIRAFQSRPKLETTQKTWHG